MTSGAIGLDLAEVAKSNAPQLLDVPAAPGVINEKNEKTLVIDDKAVPLSEGSLTGPDGEEYPTAEEVDTLRRICGAVPWSAYTVAFVELCERFSYYGTTAVCKFPLRKFRLESFHLDEFQRLMENQSRQLHSKPPSRWINHR